MQIEGFTRIRNVSIVVTITCAIIILLCHAMDTSYNDVNALRDYITYAESVISGEDIPDGLPESCSMLLRNDSIYKADPDRVHEATFNTVEEMEEFVDGWSFASTHKINPYINAYIKQSLWEYADWCINDESDDYWHMKYVASQKTGGYSYARQIKYRWYKFGYENAPFIVMASLFTFVFVNVLCIIYGLRGASKKSSNTKMPKLDNSCNDDK